jgi:long-chain acyl-CoA synthetase
MMGIEGTDEELCAHPQIIQVYQDQVINPGNAQVPKFMRLKAFKLMAYTLTVEAGELTPTMKLKRGVLTEKFAADIASLYE